MRVVPSLRLALPLAALLCGGCTQDRSAFAGYDMSLVSEDCRSSADAASYKQVTNGESANDRQAAFDTAYRSCMAARGYVLSSAQ